jgi:hypothetical protein
MYTGVKDVDNIIDEYVGVDVVKLKWTNKKKWYQWKPSMWNFERLVREIVEYKNDMPLNMKVGNPYYRRQEDRKMVDAALDCLMLSIDGAECNLREYVVGMTHTDKGRRSECKRLVIQGLNLSYLVNNSGDFSICMNKAVAQFCSIYNNRTLHFLK